jgi:hypothetical protein
LWAAFPPAEYYGPAAPDTDIADRSGYPGTLRCWEVCAGSGVARIARCPLT